MEGGDHRRRPGRPLGDEVRPVRLRARRPAPRPLFGLLGGRGALAALGPSRHGRRSPRRGHGERRRRSRPRRVHPQGPQERHGPHHPAHRPARPGAGAAGDRRLRHQRLQGEDRADRRQAVHLADRRHPQPPAADAPRRDAVRPRTDRRGRIRAFRSEIREDPRGRCPRPGGRPCPVTLRRCPGAARRPRRGLRRAGRVGRARQRRRGRRRPRSSSAAAGENGVRAPSAQLRPAAARSSWPCPRAAR
ncbi:MAG: hypothetical protein FD152_525 [Xanthobacteraceae bacterium]|nr:MAG: hypothetical protein FD152_525 [Xanthobacteraceae bacterium]